MDTFHDRGQFSGPFMTEVVLGAFFITEISFWGPFHDRGQFWGPFHDRSVFGALFITEINFVALFLTGRCWGLYQDRISFSEPFS